LEARSASLASLGRGKALELLLTGDPITGKEAVALGLANVAVPGDAVLRTAVGLARKMATKSGPSVAALLAAVREGLETTLEAGLQIEARSFAGLTETADMREGLGGLRAKARTQIPGPLATKTVEGKANIILTGFMGTGKSAVGREVARRLGRTFVDMDELIAEREGRSIPDIFALSGESYFRRLEATLCSELAGCRDLVIATGGGALLPPANRAALGRSGVLICLTATVDDILRRLDGDADRPLLATADRRTRIEALLAERTPAYTAIPHQIDTTGKTVEQVVETVLEIIHNPKSIIQNRVPVHTPEGSYDVVISEGVLPRLGSLLRERNPVGTVALVSNDTIAPLHAAGVLRSLAEAGLEAHLFTVPDGEVYKTLDTARELYDRFLAAGIDRSSTAVALGGGVVGDRGRLCGCDVHAWPAADTVSH